MWTTINCSINLSFFPFFLVIVLPTACREHQRGIKTTTTSAAIANKNFFVLMASRKYTGLIIIRQTLILIALNIWRAFINYGRSKCGLNEITLYHGEKLVDWWNSVRSILSASMKNRQNSVFIAKRASNVERAQKRYRQKKKIFHIFQNFEWKIHMWVKDRSEHRKIEKSQLWFQ